jgi:hypothetical protein
MCWFFLRRGEDLKITSGSPIMYLRLTRKTARGEVEAKSPREADIELHAVQEIGYLRSFHLVDQLSFSGTDRP